MAAYATHDDAATPRPAAIHRVTAGMREGLDTDWSRYATTQPLHFHNQPRPGLGPSDSMATELLALVS